VAPRLREALQRPCAEPRPAAGQASSYRELTVPIDDHPGEARLRKPAMAAHAGALRLPSAPEICIPAVGATVCPDGYDPAPESGGTLAPSSSVTGAAPLSATTSV